MSQSHATLDLEALRARITVLESSLRFRLGDELVTSLQRPSRLPGLPLRLWRMIGTARRKKLWSDLREDLEFGLPDDPLRAYSDPGDTETTALRRWSQAARDPAASLPGPASTVFEEQVTDRITSLRALAADMAEPSAPERYARAARSKTERPAAPRIAMCLHTWIGETTNGYAVRSDAILQRLMASGIAVDALVRGQAIGADVTQAPYRRIGIPDKTQGALAGAVSAYAGRIAAASSYQSPDIFHAASNYVTGLATAEAAERLKRPFVYEIRGLWHITRASVRAGYDQTLAYAAQERLEVEVARRADRVIALSQPLADWLTHRGIPADRITIARNGAVIPAPAEPGTRGALRAEFGLPPEAPVFGFIGSVTPYEGLLTTLRALAELRDGHLLIVGGGDYLTVLRGQVEALGLGQRVVFTDRIPRETARACHAVIDAAVYARQATPISALVPPLKPLESMAAGVPTLISSGPALDDLIQDGAPVLRCQPGDVGSLAAQMGKLLDPDTRASLAGQSADWVRAHRDWSHTADAIAGVYRDVL